MLEGRGGHPIKKKKYSVARRRSFIQLVRKHTREKDFLTFTDLLILFMKQRIVMKFRMFSLRYFKKYRFR